MNTAGPNLPLRRTFASALAVGLLLASHHNCEAQKISARPLTPQEIRTHSLPPGTRASSGLMTVGIGEPIYLEILVDKATVVRGVTWSIDKRPLSETPSTATILESPIPASMEIYSPGDREVYQAVGRKMFIPDAPGKFTLKAVLQTDQGDVSVTGYVTGAHYTGVGVMGGSSAKYPQCALCHEERSLEYLQTAHATYFERAIDGKVSPHYGSNCYDCHVLGGSNPRAPNNGFFDIASQIGWSFPTVLQAGNWAALPQPLKAMANVQCEHCHGAGSAHHGDATTISVSLSSGDCGRCHDEEPYYNRNQQWNLSRHAVATRYPTGESRAACVPCHSGIGYIDSQDGKTGKELRTYYEAIVCAACHDPHGATNPHQLRSPSVVKLANGLEINKGGSGTLCSNCHKSRQNAVTYVKGNMSTHFGPHYSCQSDLFYATNAIEYDKVEGRPNPHLYALDDSCASCHMHEPAQGTALHNKTGGHTFRMVDDKGTPDNHDDDVPMVEGCVGCHGPMTSFDMKRFDYNLDGKTEGLQTEIHHMLEALAKLLPPVGQPTVAYDSKHTYTDAEKKAVFNYRFVEEDGSHGIHNPGYAAALLKASIEDLVDPFNRIFGGSNIPVGGPWFYSSWFGFYSPMGNSGWLYHAEHGYLYINLNDPHVIHYDYRQAKWYLTTASAYPNVFDFNTSKWMYYAGIHDGLRYFYDYSTGSWTGVR